MRHAATTRRSFLSHSSRLAASIGLMHWGSNALAHEMTFAHSSGSDTVRAALPANACDCHMHIYDDRFPWASGAKLLHAPATVAMYRQLQSRLKTQRTVVVTPSAYGTDNSCTLDALQQLGAQARGVAVLDTSASDADIERLHRAGVRGLRFNLAVGSVTAVDMIEPLAARIAPLGWHVQVNMSNKDVLANRELLERLPVPLVFDHFARIPLDAQPGQAMLDLVTGLMQSGRAYVKVSGAYLHSKTGAPNYSDMAPLAQTLIRTAPTQVLWGSDWPHPTEQHKPDDAQLLDVFGEWAATEAVAKTILVDNPARLYHF